jgi:hypothetical protein
MRKTGTTNQLGHHLAVMGLTALVGMSVQNVSAQNAMGAGMGMGMGAPEPIEMGFFITGVGLRETAVISGAWR